MLLMLLVAVSCGGSVRRSDDDDGSVGSSGNAGSGGSTTGFLSGAHFLTFSASLSPADPFVAALDFTRDGPTFSFTIQPLAAIDRSTPVGSPSQHGPFPHDDAAWNATLMSPLAIPGEANPVTGNPIVLDDLVFASRRIDPVICGSASGNLTQPAMISLDGSTFTLIPVTDLAPAPEPPPINCAGDLADPL